MKSGSGTILPLNNNKPTILTVTSLNITSDNISIDHDLIFARPISTDHFNCIDNIPDYIGEGLFEKDLKYFPLDDLPSDKTCTTNIRISPSEMCFTLLQLYNHPTNGTLSQTWKNVDTNTTFYETQYEIPSPQNNWELWYSYIWSYVGHFTTEILIPGNYQCITNTPWGSAIIDFKVVDTTPKIPIEEPIIEEPTTEEPIINEKINTQTKILLILLGFAALGIVLKSK